jgi:hypothetical protein
VTVHVPARWLEELRRAAGSVHPLIAGMHNVQRAFVQDKRTRKAWRAGRRSGKSHGLAGWFFEGMEETPGERSVYVALSRSKAKQILWDGALERMKRDFNLPIRLSTSDGQLMVRHKNGSSLWLVGCKDKQQAEKLRGERFKRAAVDEAQAFPDWIEYLVEDCLDPALMDLSGSLALTGTPSATAIGYFYEVTMGLKQGWGLHHSTVLDNTSMPHARAWLEAKRKQLGWDETHPTYLREWMGQWVDDPGALVYPISWDNAFAPDQSQAHPYGLPPGDYVYGLGIDLGFSERSTAFVMVAVRRGTGEIYVLRSYTRSRLIPTALASHVNSVREKLQKETGKGLRVVVDEGALGKGYAEQMRSMGVGCEPAEKTEKRAYQEFVGGIIRSKSMRVNFGECQELLSETRKLQFDPETGEEDERYPRHCADALLYIVRAMFPRYEPEETEPEFGTLEWHKREQARERARVISEQIKRKRRTSGLISPINPDCAASGEADFWHSLALVA